MDEIALIEEVTCDPSQIFNVASSSEMDHARDLIRNQIIESRLNN
jgi:hypothetical protein